MDTLAEDNILLLLADSNLPLGGFHFSAGLESSTKHGFLPLNTSTAGPSPLVSFLESSLRQHARSTLSFVARAYALAAAATPSALAGIASLDALYESMTSNHITRRGSKIQGVGMLTIWQKALKRPAWLAGAETDAERERAALMDALRQEVRVGKIVGHMPVAWGVLCACLGISLERALHLHLYLHARSLLSSSVRLNQTGPYHAQLLLLHAAPALIAEELKHFLATTPADGPSLEPSNAPGATIAQGAALSWLGGGFAAVGDDDGIAQTRAEQERRDRLDDGAGGAAQERGPATTWPVGEMLQARHDVMHSRMFNT